MRPLLVAALLPAVALAAPVEILHQGRLYGPGGSPLTGDHTVTVALFDVASGGTAVFSETRTVAFANGYYNLRLSSEGGSDLDPTLFDDDDLWIAFSVDGGTPSARQRLASVPYALRADTAENVVGGVVDVDELVVGGRVVVDGDGVLDVTEVRVDGTTVIDATGQLATGGTLDALGCTDGEHPEVVAGDWSCVSNDAGALSATLAGASLSLGAGTTVGGEPVSTGPHLTADQVRTYVTEVGIDLHGDTTLDGQVISTGPHLSAQEVRLIVTDDAIDLHAGSTVDGSPIATGAHLGGLDCDADEVPRFDGGAWTCAAPVRTGILFVPRTQYTITTGTAGTGANGRTGATPLTTDNLAAARTSQTALTANAASGNTGDTVLVTTLLSGVRTGGTTLTTAAGGDHNHTVSADREYNGYYGYCDGSPPGGGDCTTSANGWTEIRTDSNMVTYFRVNGASTHTHGVASHDHSMPDHNHAIAAHNHSLAAHTHSIAPHDHEVPAHQHTVPAHSHEGFAHQHTATLTIPARGWQPFAQPFTTRPTSVVVGGARLLSGSPAPVAQPVQILYWNEQGFSWSVDGNVAEDVLVGWTAQP
jgi:hypothetical protein